MLYSYVKDPQVIPYAMCCFTAPSDVASQKRAVSGPL